MQYVVGIVNEKGEKLFFHTAGCTVYCPELATKYNTRKNALSMKSYLRRQKGYKFVEVFEYTPELVNAAHNEHKSKGEKFVETILNNMDDT